MKRAPTAAQLAPRLREIVKVTQAHYPHLLADEARKAAGRSRDRDLGFGLTPPRTLLRLLRSVSAGPRDVFVDLGSGVGQAVLTAALVCKSARGYEVLPEMVRASRRSARSLGIANTRFHATDLREARIADATVVFSYSTCFTRPLMKALAVAAAGARDGARVISVSGELVHPDLVSVGEKRIHWGIPGHSRTVYWHQVRKRR